MLNIGGLSVIVADAAGLRESDDLVEGTGVQRGVETLAFYSPSCSIDFTYGSIINSVKNADEAFCVLPSPRTCTVLVVPTSTGPPNSS